MKLELGSCTGCGKQKKLLEFFPSRTERLFSPMKSSNPKHSAVKKQKTSLQASPLTNADSSLSTLANSFKEGDLIKISFPEDIVRNKQTKIGEWKNEMRNVLHKCGTFVEYKDKEKRIAVVRYNNDPNVYLFNSTLLTPVQPDTYVTQIKVGELVRISNNEKEIRRLQSHSDDFVSDMIICLGGFGYVTNILTDGGVQVRSATGKYIWPRQCLRHVRRRELEEITARYKNDRIFTVNDVVAVIDNSKTHTKIKFGVIKQCYGEASNEIHVKIDKLIQMISPECLMKVIPTQCVYPSTTWRQPDSSVATESPGKKLKSSENELLERLFDAINTGDAESLSMLEKESHFQSIKDKLDVSTVIAMCCEANQIAGITWLVKITNGSCIHIREHNKPDGQQVIHRAAACQKSQILLYVLSQGAAVNSPSECGTPLEIAVKKKFPENVEILRKHGARMNIQNEEGETSSEETTRRLHLETFGQALQHEGNKSPHPVIPFYIPPPLLCDNSDWNLQGLETTFKPFRNNSQNFLLSYPTDGVVDGSFLRSTPASPTPSSWHESVSTTSGIYQPLHINPVHLHPHPPPPHHHHQQEQLIVSEPSSSSACNQMDSFSSHNVPSPSQSSRSSSPLLSNPETESNDIKKKVECVICMNSNFQVVFQCGHGCCMACSKNIVNCPICRATIRQRIVVYSLLN